MPHLAKKLEKAHRKAMRNRIRVLAEVRAAYETCGYRKNRFDDDELIATIACALTRAIALRAYAECDPAAATNTRDHIRKLMHRATGLL